MSAGLLEPSQKAVKGPAMLTIRHLRRAFRANDHAIRTANPPGRSARSFLRRPVATGYDRCPTAFFSAIALAPTIIFQL